MIDQVPAETICPLEFSVAKSFSYLWTTPRLKVDKILENDEQNVQQSTIFGTGELRVCQCVSIYMHIKCC